MNYDNQYSSNMDWIRKEFNLEENAQLCDCIGKIVTAYKNLVETKKGKEDDNASVQDNKPKASKTVSGTKQSTNNRKKK